jgi:CheY-like chemotaxis protein
MPTILVIDDDPKFLAEAAELIAGAGYDVLRAADAVEAVEVLEKSHGGIDLVIVDLSLPGTNGFEMIGALSRRPNPIKIIATTAVYQDQFLEMTRALGAHAAVRKPPEGKPLSEKEWVDTIRRLIGGAAPRERFQAVGAGGLDNDSEPNNGRKTNR